MLLGCYSSGVRKNVRIRPFFNDQGEVTVQTAGWGPKISRRLFSAPYCARAGLHTVNMEQVAPLVDVRCCSGCLSTHAGVLFIAVRVVCNLKDADNDHLAAFQLRHCVRPCFGLKLMVTTTTAAHFPRLDALVRLLPHLIRAVPDYTGAVPQTDLFERTWPPLVNRDQAGHACVHIHRMNWTLGSDPGLCRLA